MMSLIDFHTHILPGIDDGSKDVEMSVSMLKLLAKTGIDRAVLTPHFYANHDSPVHFLEKRNRCVKKLSDAISDKDGLPKISVGAEVYFFEGISDCEFLSEMAVDGTDCVMIEMPMKQWSDRNLQELVGIRQKQKLTPIIAHLDRYVKPFQGRKLFERILSLPVLVQVNASFFINRRTRKLALSLLKEGKIHLIGSDCHNESTRPPNVDAAMQIIVRALGENALADINKAESRVLNY